MSFSFAIKGRVVLLLSGVLLAGLPMAGHAASKVAHESGPASSCSVHATNYQGWKAEEMANPWLKLEIVPQLGGRLMQVTFGGHDFLFVNQQLRGQVLPLDTAQRRWNNYGGDKIWPMPEGNEDEQHWAGASGEPLDASPFTLKVLSSRGSQCTVRLTGPVDPAIGQRYIRDISITADSPVISFHAVMKNVTGYPQTWSEQSVSQYNAASPDDPSQFNPKFWGMTPANSTSAFPNSYFVRTGNPDNPGYTISDGLFRVHWNNMGGEVWVDSPAGWLAVVDGSTGYTMIERNHFQSTAIYPGKATMLFFTTGQHTRHAPQPGASATGRSPNAGLPSPPIYYMEAEVNSPMVELQPGETYAMDTQWYPTRMGSDFKTTTWAGVIGSPLAAAATPEGLAISGDFGVFYSGDLVVHYYNRGGAAIGTAKVVSANPLESLQLQSTVKAPPETARISLHLVDSRGVDRGPLGEAFVNPQPRSPAARQ